ncbi:MAG: hypothetical protein EBS23_00830 [Betaproteobacteria bacterium]|nr:hypothetical protein [Betaproteobacteria bacterium]
MSTVRDTFGLCCPTCGKDHALMVEITTMARLHGDGTETVGDEEWAIDSPCGCTACGTWGIVGNFIVSEGGQP